jgi:monoamine oxidase
VQPALDRLSVADYLDRHDALLTQPYLRPLIVAAMRSEFGVELAECGALQLIGVLPTVDGQRVDVLGATDEAFVVKGGSATIADALAAQLGGRVETGRRLESITSAGEGYRLAFTSGAPADADFVIFAMPHPPLRRVNFAMGLPPLLRRFIAETGPGANEKIIQTFRRRAWRVPAGFSKEAWTQFSFSEAWDSSAAAPERSDGALTFFFGGRQTATMDAALSLAALDRVIPGLAAAAAGRVLRTNWSADPLCGGAYTSLKPGQTTEFAEFFWGEEREVRAGRIFFAGEQTSERYYGYMNGAVESGHYAAEAVVRHITGA